VRLLLISVVPLLLACATQPSGRTSAPTDAEPVLFVEVPPEPPRAEPEPTEPPPAHDIDRADAKRLFQEGVQLYEAGDIAGAVEKFEEAYDTEPLPALLFNIARGYDQLGDVAQACFLYGHLKTDPASDDRMRDEAAKRIAQLSCP
jgi:tetratricopeptide (TPR) repeat protein